ncbi:hypothetical protein A4D02_27885 [Niastella koreensis]|uniref:Uncharacterized protein n=2 Tax=Niastella koreensis TaxID=354356 RepID=G8TI49_NIAKG|nr:hypothetical protein Niako_3339 [Niastella koreensis GR20-10]OQP49900.1 hypothetical protein A4D02_27885 [Niastella koreensis]
MLINYHDSEGAVWALLQPRSTFICSKYQVISLFNFISHFAEKLNIHGDAMSTTPMGVFITFIYLNIWFTLKLYMLRQDN